MDGWMDGWMDGHPQGQIWWSHLRPSVLSNYWMAYKKRCEGGFEKSYIKLSVAR